MRQLEVEERERMKGMCNRRSGNKRIYRKKRLEVEERERE